MAQNVDYITGILESLSETRALDPRSKVALVTLDDTDDIYTSLDRWISFVLGDH